MIPNSDSLNNSPSRPYASDTSAQDLPGPAPVSKEALTEELAGLLCGLLTAPYMVEPAATPAPALRFYLLACRTLPGVAPQAPLSLTLNLKPGREISLYHADKLLFTHPWPDRICGNPAHLTAILRNSCAAESREPGPTRWQLQLKPHLNDSVPDTITLEGDNSLQSIIWHESNGTLLVLRVTSCELLPAETAPQEAMPPADPPLNAAAPAAHAENPGPNAPASAGLAFPQAS